MKQRLTFPIFNAIIGAIFGAAIGYYIFRLGLGILIGSIVGFLLASTLELLLSRLNTNHWLYRRRILLLVLLEIPLAILFLGPYVYVVAYSQSDHHSVCCETPLAYGAAEYEDIQILTDDGITLSGWYVPPRNPPGAVIVLLHGVRGDRRGTAWHARQLIQAGYGLFLYDQRGLGESTGEKVYLEWMQGGDLLSVIGYLEKRVDVDVDKIGVVGISSGGHIALNAVYLDPSKISALWLDGIQAQGVEDIPDVERLDENFIKLINAMIWKMAEVYYGESAPPPFVEILATFDEPEYTIVAGVLDDFEYRVSKKFAEVTGENAHIWQIENAWHVAGPVVVPEEYRRRMLEFFESTLGK